MHKWWARRLGSVFRTIVLYSLADDEIDGWNQDPRNLWEVYSQETDLKGKIVLDPMMGGGVTLVEALRLGCQVIGGDLNPVAWFVVKKQIEDINPKLLVDSLAKLETELGLKLRKYYRTVCPECENNAEGIYYFYCKDLQCPECKTWISLMPDYFLAKSPVDSGVILVCPGCWEIFHAESANQQSDCPSCETQFHPKQSSSVRGQSIFCPICDSGEHKIIDLIQRNGRPRERLYAVEFYCEDCDRNKNPRLKRGRGYKKVGPKDLELLEEAKQEYWNTCSNLLIPETEIPSGVETKRPLNHGYKKFSDLFNERQLLNLGKIFRWIRKVKDKNLREFLVLAFSNCLKYNNMFAKYNSTRGFITDIFRTHSFSPSMAPVEGNCYDTKKGRGAFTAFIRLVKEGKEYCRNPFERVVVDGEMTKLMIGKPIHGRVVSDFNDVTSSDDVFLQCGSSTNLKVPDACVDAVVTDPPYADNVMYSELSNFFYVWLRLILHHDYSHFQSELVPWEDEVIVNPAQEKDETDFMTGLTAIFTECKRVLKDEGVLVFTFHHKKTEAWSSLLRAVLDSGFVVTAIHPVRSEMKASTHLYDMENITIDAIIVCRKRMDEAASNDWRAIMTSITETLRELLTEFDYNGTTLAHSDLRVVAFGKCVEHYSKNYPNVMIDGRRMGVSEALESIGEIIEQIVSN
jgi:adenine-specific DNA methylase